MFLMLQRFIDMMNVLDILYKPITSKSFSIPDDMSGEPQYDALADVLLLWL
jgi:hypothetical protein